MVYKNKLFIPFICLLMMQISSCTITRKVPEGKYYLGKNSFEVKGGKFNKVEKSALLQRFQNQLDDSSQTSSKDVLFVLHFITRPPRFDTAFAAASASNIEASMYHLGYYDALTSFDADTIGKKVNVHYTIYAGNPTLIDTVSYYLKKPDIQNIVNNSLNKKVLVPGRPITKAAVLGEMGRIVDTLRNHGYYKFTAGELRVRGDTSIAALTQIGDNPFEDLLLLAQAQAQKDSPKIKLAVVLNPTNDSSKLEQYRIRKIYVLPDFYASDKLTDSTGIRELRNNNYVIRYHEDLFKVSFLARTISLRSGQIFSQKSYNETLFNLSKTGVWQSTNIRILEVPDSNLIDLVIELIPAKKFGFEAALEASYSAVSNTNNALAGNLFGLSTNFSLTNRNIGKEAIQMTHSVRAGVELNNRNRTNNATLINSNELSYSNNIIFPRLISPFPKLNRKRNLKAETFVNSSLSYNNRLSLFNLQTAKLNYGFSIKGKNERKWTFRFLNAEFSYLFNQTDSFNTILAQNQFLKYAYNTALVLGTGASYSSTFRNPNHLASLSKERTITINFEESGLTYGALPIFKKYKKKFLKTDVEYKYTVTYPKTALAFRLFVGVGIPLKHDTTLPFFKQYFGGGSNSMRGWPVRGIGLGGQPLATLSNNTFNNRTGDIRFESNVEYRYIISRIIPNTLTLGGAVFIDAGNIWNFRNTNNGLEDTAQFKFKNFYQQLGLSAGTGFRLDFNYFILRLDLGFRFKRPETSYINNGWQIPKIGLDDAFKKLFSGSYENRKWRYENFNFTIGISYPF